MIYLLRHLKTGNNANGRISGQSETVILNGEKIIDENGVVSRIQLIYTSPATRCLDTLKIAGIKGTLIQDVRLMERNMGIFEGRIRNEIKAEYPEYFTFEKFDVFQTPPKGETFKKFYHRLYAFYDENLKDIEQDILVCSHNQVLKVLKSIIQHKEITRTYWNLQNFENGKIYSITQDEELIF